MDKIVLYYYYFQRSYSKQKVIYLYVHSYKFITFRKKVPRILKGKNVRLKQALLAPSGRRSGLILRFLSYYKLKISVIRCCTLFFSMREPVLIH